MMNIKIFALLLVVLVVFASGCAAQTGGKEEVKTPEQASKAAQDVGESVGDVAAKIADVDKGLSG